MMIIVFGIININIIVTNNIITCSIRQGMNGWAGSGALDDTAS